MKLVIVMNYGEFAMDIMEVTNYSVMYAHTYEFWSLKFALSN